MHNNWYDNTRDHSYSNRANNHSDHHLELQLQTVDTKSSSPNPSAPSSSTSATESSHDWISAFNTSLLTTRANTTKDRSIELNELMQTPEFASLLVGAQHLAASQGLSKEEATERLIEVFRRMDFAWKQIIIKRGLQSIIE
jgi:hypothetical protein